ncbi:MAG: altronate dehydratase family protein [Lachnospiraceae bacterium]
MKKSIQINPMDNVSVALLPISKGTILQEETTSITIQENIPQGHKFARQSIGMGEEVIKYGSRIGYATKQIEAGEWVHVHNIKTALGEELKYTYEPVNTKIPSIQPSTFMGYRRQNGKVGIRNAIWIIPTVGCVNSIVRTLEKNAAHLVKGCVEEVVAFMHPYGCSQMGEDQEYTRQVLADMVNHPNAGGVLVVGLGCENSNIDVLKQYIGTYDEKRVRFLQCQEEEQELETGMQLLSELADYAGAFHREPIDAGELVIGMKCGGSDGLSGITANPLVGAFSDKLIAQGGTTILTEVPEMFGAETLLMNRCADEMRFHQTEKLIREFKEYYTSHHQTIYENPSPGNKQGGISTLEDKSLGCTQKSGHAAVTGVLDYTQCVTERGLYLLSAPGNDLVASTALAIAGAHMVLFTTGRGTPFASPVPTVKISSNTQLSMGKHNWIDFNAGSLVEDQSMEILSQQLFDYVLEVASGKQVKSEQAGYHDMAIFKQGVTL